MPKWARPTQLKIVGVHWPTSHGYLATARLPYGRCPSSNSGGVAFKAMLNDSLPSLSVSAAYRRITPYAHK